MDGHAARIEMAVRETFDRGAIELALEPGRKCRERFRVGPGATHGRHHAASQLSHDLFPDFGPLARMSHVLSIEREARGGGSASVARHAILVEDLALRRNPC